MLLSNISFFIECVNLLKDQYHKASPSKKKQLATFLKTWLFYNSTSKSIFWTGFSTKEGIVEQVKEHRYSTLASTKYLLQKDVRFENNRQQILWVFEKMQWNYTSSDENKRMSKLQQFETFYGRMKGELSELYREAKIELVEEKKGNNFYPTLDFFLNSIDSPNTIITEIELPRGLMNKFEKGLNYSITHLCSKVEVLKVPSKGFIIKAASYSNIFEAIQCGFLYSMKLDQLKKFSLANKYQLQENSGPYRLINTFVKETNRVFKVFVEKTPVYLSTYNNTNYKMQLMNRIAEFNDSILYFFDSKLNLITQDDD